MEDILYYIGLGLIITISLARKAGKNSPKKGAGRVDSGNPTPIPGFPPINNVPEELKKFPQPEFSEPVVTKPQPQAPEYHYEEVQSLETITDEAPEAQSLETIFDEVREAQYTYVSAKNNAKNKAKAKSKTSKSSDAINAPKSAQKPAKTDNKPQSEEQNEVLKDFDLRDAVIYSEILRPKFEE